MSEPTKPADASPSSITPKTVTGPILDRLGVALSGVCLLHCLAIPLAVLLGVGGWLSETETVAHWFLLALAAPISLTALARGRRLNLALGVAGLAFMLLAVTHVAGASLEVLLTTVGVLFLAIAHIRNLGSYHRHA